MAITKTSFVGGKSTAEEYSGLSTDTKPTTVTNNSTYLEYDTGDAYIFNSGAWHKIGGGA